MTLNTRLSYQVRLLVRQLHFESELHATHNVIIDGDTLPPEGGVPRARREHRLQAADVTISDAMLTNLCF